MRRGDHGDDVGGPILFGSGLEHDAAGVPEQSPGRGRQTGPCTVM
jgi:hypothetical protein